MKLADKILAQMINNKTMKEGAKWKMLTQLMEPLVEINQTQKVPWWKEMIKMKLKKLRKTWRTTIEKKEKMLVHHNNKNKRDQQLHKVNKQWKKWLIILKNKLKILHRNSSKIHNNKKDKKLKLKNLIQLEWKLWKIMVLMEMPLRILSRELEVKPIMIKKEFRKIIILYKILDKKIQRLNGKIQLINNKIQNQLINKPQILI